MFKKIIITILVISVGVGGYIFFTTQKSQTGTDPRGKFFAKNLVNDSDLVIRQTESGFEPEEVTVKKGQRVVWVNETSTFIWPASNLHPTHNIYSEFDPREPFNTGMAWSFVFDKTGEWTYHDHLKPNRRGVIKVE